MSLGRSVNLVDAGDAEDALPADRVLALLVVPLAGLMYMVFFPLLLPVLLVRFAVRQVLRRRTAPRAEPSGAPLAQSEVSPFGPEPAARWRASARRRVSEPPVRRRRGPTTTPARRRFLRSARRPVGRQGPA